MRAVWDVEKSHREATPTRERISINGLWHWQPAADATESVPAGGWGHVRVPQPWPGGDKRFTEPSVCFPDPAWPKSLADVTTAWYQREITVPAEWTRRRMALHTGDELAGEGARGRGKAGEIRYPAGEIDLPGAVWPGGDYVLSLLVRALTLKVAMLAFNDTANAREVQGRVDRRGLCGDVSLSGTPAGPHLGQMTVETSVRQGHIAFSFEVVGLQPQGSYVVQATVREGRRFVQRFASPSFALSDLAQGRHRLCRLLAPRQAVGHPHPASVRSRRSPARRAAPPARPATAGALGFREFWIGGARLPSERHPYLSLRRAAARQRTTRPLHGRLVTEHEGSSGGHYQVLR